MAPAPLTGPTVIVSDLHCTPRHRPTLEVAKLARSLGARNLIVAGDLFDDLHQALPADALAEALRWAFRGAQGLTVHYVTSGSSHDPIQPSPAVVRAGPLRVHVYPRYMLFSTGAGTIFVTHGDVAVPNGLHAFAINLAARLVGEELFIERRLRERLGLPPGWWLVMGHTHLPGIDYGARVANAGSWRESWRAGLPYYRPPSRTFILADGDLRLLRAPRRDK